MVELHLRPEIEQRLRDQLSAGADANDLMEVALLAFSERTHVSEAIEAGWIEAEAGIFVSTSVDSVIQRADNA